MNILADLSIFPLDKGQSVSEYVAKAIKVIEKSSVEYQIGPMGTCIEGNLDQVMDIIKECMNVLGEDCNRIYLTLEVDYRKGRTGALKGKVASVQRHLKK